jgi:hypothetical protein
MRTAALLLWLALVSGCQLPPDHAVIELDPDIDGDGGAVDAAPARVGRYSLPSCSSSGLKKLSFLVYSSTLKANL